MKHSIKSITNTSKKPATFTLAIRVNEDEYLACREIAEIEQRSISQVGRILIQNSLKERTGQSHVQEA